VKRVVAVLALLGTACAEPPPEPPPEPELPPFELRAVVREKLEELAPLAQEKPFQPADDEHVQGLVGLVAGADPAMREVALEEAAGQVDGFAEALKVLARTEGAPDADRRAAIQLLGRMDRPHAAAALVEVVLHGDPAWVRAHAAWRLGETTQDWVVPELFLRLKYENDHDTVVWLAKTLAHFGNYSGMRALSVVANEASDVTLRASAAARMAEVVEASGFESVEELWSAWIAGADAEAFRPARSPRFDLEIWRRLERLSEFQLRGVDDSRYVFEGLGFHTAELLAEALHDEDVYVRVHCAQGLQRMGPRGAPAGPTLIEALGETELAPHAATALGAIGFEPAVPVLAQCLEMRSRPDLRLAAARALRGFSGDAAVEPLRQLLAADQSEELRQAAAESLAHLGHGGEVAALLCDFIVSPKVEPVSSEHALRAWIAGEAEVGKARADELLAEWDALVIPNDAIIPAEEKLASREARRRLVLDALPELTP